VVGGWLCLDFVNTVHAWVPAAPGGRHGDDDTVLEEKLTSYDAPLHWSEQAGALDASGVAPLENAAARHPREAANRAGPRLAVARAALQAQAPK